VYACICLAVTVTEVAETIAAGAGTEVEVAERCGAGTGCGSCLDRICAMISEQHPLHGRAPLRAAV
jgi:bacterioferritin-associated ferredoxin